MNELSNLPSCHVFRVEPLLRPLGARASMLEASENEDGELALVLPADDQGTWPDPASVGRRRGVATLRDEEETPVVEWAETPRELAAVFSRALARLGWRRSIHASFVYGDAS